jgi:hypothetical protein
MTNWRFFGIVRMSEKTVQERLSPTHLNTLFIEPQTGGSELFSAASSAMQPLVDARLDAIAAQRGVLDRHLELLMKASPETIVAFAEAEEARKFQGSLGPTLAKRLEELRVTLGVMRAANIEGFASWKAERFHPDLRQTIVSLTGCFFSEIPSIAEPHSDIALTLQKIFERTVLHAVQSGH